MGGGHLSPILSIETIILPIFSVSFLFGPMLVFSLSFHKSCMRCDLGRFNLVSPVFCLMLFLASPVKLEQRRKGRFHKFIRKLEKSSKKPDFYRFGGPLETQEWIATDINRYTLCIEFYMGAYFFHCWAICSFIFPT